MTAAEKKRGELMDYIDNLNIVIPDSDWNFSPDDYDCEYAREIVNDLRHSCDQYESELDKLCGKTGHQLAYRRLKCRVLTAIGKKYPCMKWECDRQKRRMY